MSKEIMAGLRIALERGSSLKKAAQTFLNAGYNPMEVEAAAKMISSGGGAVSIVEAREPQPAVAMPQKQIPLPQKRKKGRGLVISLIVLAIIILLGAIGYLVYVLAF